MSSCGVEHRPDAVAHDLVVVDEHHPQRRGLLRHRRHPSGRLDRRRRGAAALRSRAIRSRTWSRKSLIVASATRNSSARSIARPTAPSGGTYRALIDSWQRSWPSGATSRSASSAGNSPVAPAAVQRRGQTDFVGSRIGSPTSIATRARDPDVVAEADLREQSVARVVGRGRKHRQPGVRLVLQNGARPGHGRREAPRSSARTCRAVCAAHRATARDEGPPGAGTVGRATDVSRSHTRRNVRSRSGRSSIMRRTNSAVAARARSSSR